MRENQTENDPPFDFFTEEGAKTTRAKVWSGRGPLGTGDTQNRRLELPATILARHQGLPEARNMDVI
jgi:hypothetical protein